MKSWIKPKYSRLPLLTFLGDIIDEYSESKSFKTNF